MSALCSKDPDPLQSLPAAGEAVRLLGPEVLDVGHAGWVEIHPLLAWTSNDPPRASSRAVGLSIPS
jgi:hypothetical protein